MFSLKHSEIQLLVYDQILLRLASSMRGVDERSQGEASINFVPCALGNLIIWLLLEHHKSKVTSHRMVMWLISFDCGSFPGKERWKNIMCKLSTVSIYHLFLLLYFLAVWNCALVWNYLFSHAYRNTFCRQLGRSTDAVNIQQNPNHSIKETPLLYPPETN